MACRLVSFVAWLDTRDAYAFFRCLVGHNVCVFQEALGFKATNGNGECGCNYDFLSLDCCCACVYISLLPYKMDRLYLCMPVQKKNS